MIIINGKAMLKIGNRYIPPGKEVEVPESLGKKLKQAGLATETASVKPKENAMMPKAEAKGLGDFVRKVTEKPKPLGGGWYQLPDGRKVRKKDLEEGD